MEFIQRLSKITDVDLLIEESMAKHTGYGVGGNAKVFINVYTAQALKEVVDICIIHGEKYKFLGNGTNVLVSDKGYDGAIISLKGLNKIFVCNDCVTALSGVSLCNLINFAYKHGLYGAQALSGIPATVGGALVMNAGAFGVCIADFVESVTTLKNGRLHRYSNSECKFEYRKSIFLSSNQPVVSANFRFFTDEKYKNLDKLTDCSRQRNLHQPQGRSCGCVFKNPEGDFAGRLIDVADLKGLQIGGAKVSPKHGNFILTDGSACASDVYNLISIIKESVFNKFGIILKEEIEFLGEF